MEGYPDETDVCETAVAQLPSHVVRLGRGKLFITAANGEAVYVPVGESALRGCSRYGRLYGQVTADA